jgi:hypothetical protein
MRPAARSKTNVMVVVFLLFLFVYTAHNVVYLRINTGFNCLEQMVYDSVQRFYLLQDDPGGMPRMIWQSIGPEGRERSLYEIFCCRSFFSSAFLIRRRYILISFFFFFSSSACIKQGR